MNSSVIDITEFINSRDIREYHRKIGYSYNTIEAAWIVYWCSHATLAEKHAAWKWIIENLADMMLADYSDYDYLDGNTIHQILAEYIDLQMRYIAEFKREYINWYFTCVRPARLINGVLKSFDPEGAFSSYDKCVEYALEHVDFTKSDYIVIKRGKIDIMEPLWHNGGVYINCEGEIVDVYPEIIEEWKNKRFRYFFDSCCLDLPVPFKRGDIVCTDYDLYMYRKPIVLTDVFVHLDSIPEDHAKYSKEFDAEDMCVAGYAAVDTWQFGLYRNTFGNYMDVEYYRDELKEIDRILKPLSDWLKGEYGDDISQVLNEYHRIMQEEEMKKYES